MNKIILGNAILSQIFQKLYFQIDKYLRIFNFS